MISMYNFLFRTKSFLPTFPNFFYIPSKVSPQFVVFKVNWVGLFLSQKDLAQLAKIGKSKC